MSVYEINIINVRKSKTNIPPKILVWDFENNEWLASVFELDEYNLNGLCKLKLLDIKEFDAMLMQKDMKMYEPYVYHEGDLNDVQFDDKLKRNQRLTPSINGLDLSEMNDDLMLVQGSTYKFYFDFAKIIHEKKDGLEVRDEMFHYTIIPTAKALDYGLIMQSDIMVHRSYNPVIQFPEDEPKYLAYIISVNVFVPSTINIKRGTFLAYLKFNKGYL